ncbi:hypothetical protein FB379_10717 [Aeribacillus composti]|nr:hypothetical protein FB379_10717 [Aeribacillus composti]
MVEHTSNTAWIIHKGKKDIQLISPRLNFSRILEIRKRLKPMNSLSSLEAAEKVVYLTVQDFNEKWAGRKLRGFAEAHETLQRMFEERYC